MERETVGMDQMKKNVVRVFFFIILYFYFFVKDFRRAETFVHNDITFGSISSKQCVSLYLLHKMALLVNTWPIPDQLQLFTIFT